MDRNRLKGISGDRINAIFSAAGMSFYKLQQWAADYYRQFFLPLLCYQKSIDHIGDWP